MKLIALVVALIPAGGLAACGTVPVHPPGAEAPLVRRIDARVGKTYTAAARLAFVTNPLMRMDVGQASVDRFDQAFSAMFAETVALPDWPPWRHEAHTLDAVIELERVDARVELGDDRSKPDVVSIGYRICLYEPDAIRIACWSPTSDKSHQRSGGECFDLRECVVPQVEVAMREALALFLVAAEKDPAVLAWAARLRSQGIRP